MGKPAIVCDDGGGLVELIGGVAPADIASSVEGITERLEYYYDRRNKEDEEASRRVAHARRFHIDTTASEFSQVYKKTLAKTAATT